MDILNLNKGEILNLTKAEVNKLDIGLGWDTKADLDVHAVARTADGTILKRVSFMSKRYDGIQLSGDNLTGEGAGDDEIIFINRKELNPDTKIISIYVNVFTSGMHFKDVKGSYARIIKDGQVVAKSVLTDKSLDSMETVHFADIFIGDNDLTYKVIFEGSNDGVKKMSQLYNGKQVETKKKKLFGLF